MKRNLSLNHVLITLLLGVFFISCSSDDDKLRLPVMTENLEDNEVRIVFSPTVEQAELKLQMQLTGESENKILVNWGEDEFLHETPSGEISHVYTDTDKDYIVTLRPSEGGNLKGLDISEPKTATRIKSLRFGKSSHLKDFNVYIKNNIMERFDLSQNPQFNDNQIFFYVNTPNFNMNDFKDIKVLNFDISIPRSVHLENMTTDHLTVFYTLYNPGRVPDISIKNSRIGDVRIMNYTFDGNTFLEVDNLDLSGLDTDKMNMQMLCFNNGLDIKSMEHCGIFMAWGIDSFEKVNFSETHSEVYLDNTIIQHKPLTAIESLDFRNCPNLKFLQVRGFTNLKEILYNKTDELSLVWFTANPLMEDYAWRKSETTEMGKVKSESESQVLKRIDVLELQAN